jgi:hypothetical protein
VGKAEEDCAKNLAASAAFAHPALTCHALTCHSFFDLHFAGIRCYIGSISKIGRSHEQF